MLESNELLSTAAFGASHDEQPEFQHSKYDPIVPTK